MSLNRRPLNTPPLNSNSTPESEFVGDVNSYIINDYPVNGSSMPSEGIFVESFNCIEIEQVVGINIASNIAIYIEQDVQFRQVIEGVVIECEQSVENIVSGNVVTIEQNVIDITANTFFNRNGWVVDLTIDGYSIPHDRIKGDIYVYKQENESNQCTFSLLLSDPVGFIDEVWGKVVTLDYITSEGVDRLFTGVIAIPEIDIINKSVSFTCSNNREELINNTMSDFVKTVGRYSEAVQGKYDTPAEELNLRMQTIPYSLDFTGKNVFNLNPWAAKPVADFVFTNEDVYYRTPKVEWQDRTKIKNNYTINVRYQYTRLYHYQRPFTWDFPYEFCDFLRAQYSLPNISMIETAIQNAGWIPASNIIYTSVFPPGICTDGAFIIAWNTSGLGSRGTYSTIFDSEGNVISDPDGNNIYGFKPFTNQTDRTKIYTIGADWTGTTRFSQYVEESYTLNVFSTQSINQFGSVDDANNTSIKDDFDSSGWEDYTKITSEPSGAVSFGGGSYYFNQDTDPNAMKNAIATHVDTAKTEILSTHRNTQIIVETPIKPQLELSHTIEFDTNKIIAKGKAQKITHRLSVAEGKGSSTTLTVALSRSRGSATTTSTFVPARPSDSISLPQTSVVLQSHYGATDTSWNGHIGNKNNPVAGFSTTFGSGGGFSTTAAIRTTVQEEFRVDTPAIPDSYRKLRTLAQEADYEVAIPNDPLEVIL